MTKIKYRLATDTITKEDITAWTSWLNSNPTPWLTMGPLVKEYEEKWSSWVGRKYSISCNSGSSANLLMTYALLRSGRLKNKKVIVPSAAWPTSVSPFMQLGFEPIMCEADENNFGLDLDSLEGLLSEHQPATVMLVQVLGVPAHMDEIMALKEEYGFLLLEDACAAMGSSYHGRKVGTFGDMSSVSTFYGHQFSTLEGGVVSTDDRDLYNLLLMLRSHGWIANLDQETRSALLEKYGVEDIGTNFVFCEPGFNFRLTDVQAFLGIRQLGRMDWLVERRFENHEHYRRLLGDTFDIQDYDSETIVCSIHFCALADSYEERNKIIRGLTQAGIETRPFTAGNQGRHPYWFREYGKFESPVADRLYHCGFFLPNNPNLYQADIEDICSVVLRIVLKGGEIK